MATSSAIRKVWVRRPGASATLVSFNETDVVDDVREMLLRKYGNSLGRVYDAPDVTLRLTPRETHQGERTLGPDELMTRTLDVYYPGGQTIDEALVIDVPIRRATPTASPRGGPPHAPHLSSAYRDNHSGSHVPGDPRVDYFGPGVVPEYYNHGALTADSEYGSTLGPESAYSRPSGSQHLYPPSPGHHHPHGQQSHKAHGNASLRSPPGTTGGTSSVVSSALPVSGGPGGSPLGHPHSISIIATGQAPPIPNLPSPGGSRRSHKDRSDRPKLHRQASTTPDIDVLDLGSQMNGSHGGPSNGISSSGQKGQGSSGSKVSIAVPVSALSSKSGGRAGADGPNIKGKSGSGTNTADSTGDKDGKGTANGISIGSGSNSTRNIATPPRPMSPMRGRRQKKASRPIDDERPEVQLGPLTVPPINVLIVEDNIINLKLLEAFIKRLKVRWQTAMNGRDAVAKWRTGGFHLVLMDIQLPLMSGLEATREIRRLERVNSIGVFASTPSDSIGVGRDPRSDKLANMSLFKSPVIIVALTASSLQSDRNDALAAGCNDFLTKPVNFLWLEKKIMEWGCMQALIDFDGWRKWKELKLPSQQSDAADGSAAETSTKKSKKTSGHTKRPSVSSLSRDKGESSDTVTTVSSTESPSTITAAAHGSSSGSMSGTGSGTNSVGRSPLSKPSISERLAANETAVSAFSPDALPAKAAAGTASK